MHANLSKPHVTLIATSGAHLVHFLIPQHRPQRPVNVRRHIARVPAYVAVRPLFEQRQQSMRLVSDQRLHIRLRCTGVSGKGHVENYSAVGVPLLQLSAVEKVLFVSAAEKQNSLAHMLFFQRLRQRLAVRDERPKGRKPRARAYHNHGRAKKLRKAEIRILVNKDGRPFIDLESIRQKSGTDAFSVNPQRAVAHRSNGDGNGGGVLQLKGGTKVRTNQNQTER